MVFAMLYGATLKFAATLHGRKTTSVLMAARRRQPLPERLLLLEQRLQLAILGNVVISFLVAHGLVLVSLLKLIVLPFAAIPFLVVSAVIPHGLQESLVRVFLILMVVVAQRRLLLERRLPLGRLLPPAQMGQQLTDVALPML